MQNPPTTGPFDDHCDHSAAYQRWLAGGERAPFTISTASGDVLVSVFVRRRGQGPIITLIHGFPSSSWDWQLLEDALATTSTVVSLDLLGYGSTDKLARHTYSCGGHADIIEAVWRRLGIAETALVGHDIGGMIVQEFLDRANNGRLEVTLTNATVINSALFAEHYQPVLITRLMARRHVGRVLGRLMNAERFALSLRRTFASEHQPTSGYLAQVWDNLNRAAPQSHLPALLHYISDKKRNRQRWEHATETTHVPLQVIWGLADTALSPAIVTDIREHLPQTTITTLADVGHFPHLETPSVVTELLTTFTSVHTANRPGTHR
jgi:pimeloyl-ACP methyl ester carboxylesterase